MPAQRRVILTAEEERTLRELRQASTVPARVRERAHVVRLNAAGKSTKEIANIFECHPHTVRATVQRWQCRGLGGLWETSGRGGKPKWTEADLEYIEQCLAVEPRTYNSKQLARKLKDERLVDLSSERLRQLLKKKTIAGKEPELATIFKSWIGSLNGRLIHSPPLVG
jgi:transposase